MAKALGKGLGALIGRTSTQDPDDTGTTRDQSVDPSAGEAILHASLNKIIPSPLQPRKSIHKEQLDELKDSIRIHGVMQPLIVRKVGDKLELIAGERRWRAATALALKSVPVILRDKTDREVLEMALIENLQREDLNPIEEAEAYVRLAKEFGMRQEEIATSVGKNRATVANAMRLLDLADSVREHLAQGRLSVGHAKVLLAVKNADEQGLLADMVVKKGLTVRATEKLTSEHAGSPKSGGSRSRPTTPPGTVSSAVREVENRLREHFSTQVSVHHGEKKGRIEIDYYGDEDLQRILEVIGVEE